MMTRAGHIKHAGFPMYDFPEIRSATDAFWSALRLACLERGIHDAPLALTRPEDLPAFWQDPNLLIGQTCGYPFLFGQCGAARYVATPCYKTRLSSGPTHKSVIIVRQNAPIKTLADAQGMICAINMRDSNSGMNLLRLEIAKLGMPSPFFSRVYETRAHRNSMHAVIKGDADIAAIDCVSFALLEKIDPALTANLRIIGETETSPALPFITGPNTDDATRQYLRDALQSVCADPKHSQILKTLLLEGIQILASDAYERVREIENRAIALHYPHLA